MSNTTNPGRLASDNACPCDECNGTGRVEGEVDCFNALRGEHYTRTVWGECPECEGRGVVYFPEVEETPAADELADPERPVFAMTDADVAAFAASEGA